MSQQTPEEATQVKLDVNLAGAKIAGHTEITNCHNVQVTVKHPPYECGYTYFDIYTNPKDALDVVIALGEKHGWSFPYDGIGWIVYNYDADYTLDDKYYRTYIDALSAAITAVGNK